MVELLTGAIERIAPPRIGGTISHRAPRNIKHDTNRNESA